MWVGSLSWLPAGGEGLFSVVLACWMELLLNMDGFDGDVRIVAGVFMVEELGGEKGGAGTGGGGESLLWLKARHIQD